MSSFLLGNNLLHICSAMHPDITGLIPIPASFGRRVGFSVM